MELPINELALIAIYLIIILLTGYGVALGYHLLTFGESKTKAMSVIITYTAGSALLVIALFTTYNFF